MAAPGALARRGSAVLTALVAPVLALAVALLVTSAVLLAVGDSPVETFRQMADYGTQPRSLALTLNSAITYYLSGLAVAISFRMNLFNIGVDGQYRLAALLAASVGAAVDLPGPLHVLLVLVVAASVGGMWAGIAALLKVTRGVSEVISSIMLNFIATGLIAFLLTTDRLAVQLAGSNNIGTPVIGESGRVPGLPLVPDAGVPVFGLLVLAVLAGIGYWFVLSRTRFGFDLRAAGMSESAAVSSGVDVKRMVVTAMVLSGAVAGLVGMPQLLGASYSYGLDFPTGLGFTGIAIALLGRNNALGIAVAALLWAFLDQSAQILALVAIPREIVTIMQGTIVLSVVVAYELVRRFRLRQQQRIVGRVTAAAPPDGPAVTAATGASGTTPRDGAGASA